LAIAAGRHSPQNSDTQDGEDDMPDSGFEARRNERDELRVRESRDFRSYQDYLRVTRTYMEGPLVESMHRSYAARLKGRKPPTSQKDIWPVVDDLLEFQLYSWAYRHLQRFKYHRPDVGIFAAVNADAETLSAELDAAAAMAGDRLKLKPDIELPEYYRMVDFHQHSGGVYSDAMDGLAYELGRRTTTPSHLDPNLMYRMSYSQFPDRQYKRALDWGTGHGQGLLEWQKLHPESECHGVDISAPCLKLAYKRSVEAGYKMHFAQMDLEHLDYPDNTFDVAFHLFMFHEIPPVNLANMLKELHRVLKPGGIFAGPEFHIHPTNPFLQVIQTSHSWTNNETYAAAWYDFDFAKAARKAGFAKVSITPFAPRSEKKAGMSASYWNFYLLEK
jgi:ubiquinone/menaquinone biosynthesis C-methylase UbiE